MTRSNSLQPQRKPSLSLRFTAPSIYSNRREAGNLCTLDILTKACQGDEGEESKDLLGLANAEQSGGEPDPDGGVPGALVAAGVPGGVPGVVVLGAGVVEGVPGEVVAGVPGGVPGEAVDAGGVPEDVPDEELPDEVPGDEPPDDPIRSKGS